MGPGVSVLPLSLAEVILADRIGPGLFGGTWTKRVSVGGDDVIDFCSIDAVIDFCSIDDVIDFWSMDDAIDFCSMDDTIDFCSIDVDDVIDLIAEVDDTADLCSTADDDVIDFCSEAVVAVFVDICSDFCCTVIDIDDVIDF